jgi:NAD(P)-dependent dehydrogenase (short-subunit alcohol dehydrogenase family)
VLLTARKREGASAAELRRRNLAVLAAPVPYASIALAGGCYEVAWREAEAPRTASNGHPRRILVLADGGGVGEALVERLAREGAQCAIAVPGARLARTGEGRFTADPTRPEELRALLESAGEGHPLHAVVHLWGLDAPVSEGLTLAGLEAAQVLGCESVLHLVQAIAGLDTKEKARLWLATRRAQAVGDEAVEIAQAPLLGLGKSLLLEHPDLWGGMVDLEDGEAGASASVLASELAAPSAECHIAYRGGKRHVARLVRRRPPLSARPEIRGDASYVVTGGTGALGLRTAAWLADGGARHLVLASRRPPGEEAAAAVAALEARGVVVRVVAADVAKSEDAARLVEEATDLAPLRGVVHAAGVLDDGVLLQQTAERFRRVLAPKVQGAFNLHQATRAHDLDFFVGFSSSAALLGSAGQGNYAAGNAFLDALARWRRSAGLPGLSVSWGAWAGTGMAASLAAAQRRKLAEAGVGDIEPAEGLCMLGALIAEGRAHAGVCPMDWMRYFSGTPREAVPPYFEAVAPRAAEEARATAGGDVRASLARAGGEERRSLLGRYLQERVAHVLGYEDLARIDRDLTLLQLGFDSLMAVQLRNHIRTQLEVDVPIGKLFASTSLDGLTCLVDERLSATLSPPPEQVDVI